MIRVIVQVIEGPHKGVHLEIAKLCSISIGREISSDVCLVKDPYFSHHHCTIEVSSTDCKLVDLKSNNGTYVNDKLIQKVTLKDGDIISGGKSRIKISISAFKDNKNDETLIVSGKDTDDAVSVSSNFDSTLEPVQSIPGYHIINVLGHGAMGAVYYAISDSLKKPVALKVIIPEKQDDEDTTRLFVREASVVSQLKHPRIIQFYEFGQAAGQLYLAMEYVEEQSIQKLTDKLDPLRKIRLYCSVICQVLDGLNYAHKHSLVHRDIKPSNILITINNKKPEVKISDFGLAKNYSIAGMSGITEDGTMRGTLFYMPPEQILDSKRVKPSADIYSTGAALYNYLSRNHPFDVTTIDNGIQMILHEDIVPLDERCPDLPRGLIDVVHKALEKDPSKRYRSAKEMHKALMPFTRYKKVK